MSHCNLVGNLSSDHYHCALLYNVNNIGDFLSLSLHVEVMHLIIKASRIKSLDMLIWANEGKLSVAY